MTLRIGAGLLSLWAGANLLLAVGILVGMLALGKPPPSLPLYVPADVLQATPERVISLIHAMAIFANACAAAATAFALVLVWRGVVAGVSWALPTLAAVLGGLQLMGFASDGYLGHGSVAANVGSAVLLAAGLALCAVGRAPQATA